MSFQVVQLVNLLSDESTALLQCMIRCSPSGRKFRNISKVAAPLGDEVSMRFRSVISWWPFFHPGDCFRALAIALLMVKACDTPWG